MFYISLISFILTILCFIYLIVLLVEKYIFHDKVNNINLKLVISSSGIFLFWLTTYSLNAVYEKTQKPHINVDGIEEYSGTFGDLIGGTLNPILGLFGIIVGGLAFYAQYEANKEIQEQFKIQQFESQYYEMLRLHKENVNEMNITGYYNSIQKSIEYYNGDRKITLTESQVDKLIIGRKVFVSMINELIFCCDFCIEFNKKMNRNFNQDTLLKLGYRIFFHGSNSDFLISDDFNDEKFIEEIQKELRVIRKKHKKTNGDYNNHSINDKKIDLHIKYSPFTGHVSRLGHYYRHLFYMVKFVVEHENRNLFNYNKSRDYLKLLRAQMSNDEQLLLYYNYKIGFGGNWENRINKFLSKYRMLHNLPTGKVKYNDPTTVFKNQIEEIKKETNGKEQMFEWGDITRQKS